MSAAAATAARRAGSGTRIAAALVLIGLAALAYYALFSGPTTFGVPPRSQGAPARSAPPPQGGEPEGGGSEGRD